VAHLEFKGGKAIICFVVAGKLAGIICHDVETSRQRALGLDLVELRAAGALTVCQLLTTMVSIKCKKQKNDMKNTLLLIFVLSLISCSNKQYILKKYLSGNNCKLWKPQHWDEFHFECFDSNGKQAIYKLENGKLSHVAYIDDIVYDWD
jgi:hypothetical protein